MTCGLQSTLEAPGIEWPALRNHIPCMEHVIQLAVGAFMSSLGVKGTMKSWEAHERTQQFGENECIDIRKSQRVRKEGNAKLKKVSAMGPGLAKIIEKVRISRYFESPETNLHRSENACWNDYADTWLLKQVHWLSKGQRPHCGTTRFGCEETLEFETGVALSSLPIMSSHPRVAPEFKIQRIPATLHTTAWMDHCQVHHGSFDAIPILDHVEVEEEYGHIASCYHTLQWHVRSYGWLYASCSERRRLHGSTTCTSPWH